MIGRSAIKPEIGDVYRIPLSDGRFAYAHYVYSDFGRAQSHGWLVRVLDIIDNGYATVDQLSRAGDLFPPVYVGLRAPIEQGLWQKIATIPPSGFHYPTFRVNMKMKNGTSDAWSLWNGREMEYIGNLPEELRKLSILTIVGYVALRQRIATGECIEQVMI
jgi:hypothetical protein